MSKFTEYRDATWAKTKAVSAKAYAAAKANASADPWWTLAWFTIGGVSGWIAFAIARIFGWVE